jgi:hypothetical protein
MAFSPDGMFYLGAKELEPTMDTVGGAFRGMLGVQNKEEAVNSILQGADYDTPEGRRAALEQIRQIDPTRAEALTKQNQEYEARELALTETRNVGKLNKAWTHVGRLDALQLFAEQQLGLTPQASANIKNDTDLLNAIRTYSLHDGEVDKGLVSDINSNFSKYLERTKSAYFKQHALTDFNSYEDLKPMPESGDNVKDKPKIITDTTTTHVQEQNPQASRVGLQWEKNKRTREIDALGSRIKPGAVFDYDTDPLSSMPVYDATLGNLQDAVTSSVNAISSSLSDFGNLFTGTVAGDKTRSIAEEASDWFISRDGHNHFAGNPKALDEILNSKNRTKAALDYYKQHKAKKK